MRAIAAKKKGGVGESPVPPAGFRKNEKILDGSYLDSLWAFRAIHDLEGYPLVLLKGFEAVHLDSGVVDENVAATVTGDEAVAFRSVEPLNDTLLHTA